MRRRADRRDDVRMLGILYTVVCGDVVQTDGGMQACGCAEVTVKRGNVGVGRGDLKKCRQVAMLRRAYAPKSSAVLFNFFHDPSTEYN